jgi:hypothetical protein
MDEILKKALGMEGFNFFLHYTILPILNALAEHENKLNLFACQALQNNFYVPLATDDDELTLLTDDDGNVILADWKYDVM